MSCCNTTGFSITASLTAFLGCWLLRKKALQMLSCYAIHENCNTEPGALPNIHFVGVMGPSSTADIQYIVCLYNSIRASNDETLVVKIMCLQCH